MIIVVLKKNSNTRKYRDRYLKTMIPEHSSLLYRSKTKYFNRVSEWVSELVSALLSAIIP